MTPRGIRNNNPGNIEAGENFQGETGTDGRFAIFDTPENGIRAMFVLFAAYQTRHGLTTVRGMINRWAPPGENDTGAYVTNVAAAMGIGADQNFDIHDEALGSALINAVIRQENGQNPYTAAQVLRPSTRPSAEEECPVWDDGRQQPQASLRRSS